MSLSLFSLITSFSSKIHNKKRYLNPTWWSWAFWPGSTPCRFWSSRDCHCSSSLSRDAPVTVGTLTSISLRGWLRWWRLLGWGRCCWGVICWKSWIRWSSETVMSGTLARSTLMIAIRPSLMSLSRASLSLGKGRACSLCWNYARFGWSISCTPSIHISCCAFHRWHRLILSSRPNPLSCQSNLHLHVKVRTEVLDFTSMWLPWH